MSLAANVTAIERLGMSDHGPVHVKIVMNLAVRLLRLLMDGDVEPSVVTAYGLEREDAEVVVALAALFHDLGMAIHRADHENYSLFLANEVLQELLPQLYDVRTATSSAPRCSTRSSATGATAGRSPWRRESSGSRTPWTWRRGVRASPSRRDR
jgi:metal-dependent HD superfamily phosphatase/phosphodiesterase